MKSKNEKRNRKRIDELSGITFIRKINNLTLEQMSAKIGVSKQTISKYESGKLKPSDEVLNTLVKEFGQTKEFYTKNLEELDIIKFEKEDLLKKINKESEELEPIEQTIIDENGNQKTVMVKPVDTNKVKEYQIMIKRIRCLEISAQLKKGLKLCRVKVDGKKNTYKFKESMENMEKYLCAGEKFISILIDNNVDKVKLLNGLELIYKALINDKEDNDTIKAIRNELNAK